MNVLTRVTENWLTRKPKESAFNITTVMTVLLLLSGYVFLSGLFSAFEWMPANANEVFVQHQYWRPWTALFAHGDLGHLMNNAVMFLPLTYLLTGYFDLLLFPFMGIFIGGIINLLVLKTLPVEASLIGISGVVYWMGAVWLTLFTLLDTRKTFRRRFSFALFLTVVLFAPQSYEVGISYLSHFLGYIFGIISGIGYYLLKKKEFLAAEVSETIIEDSDFIKLEQDGVPHPEQATSVAQCPL